MQDFSDFLRRGFSILVFCDLLTKSWFSNYLVTCIRTCHYTVWKKTNSFLFCKYQNKVTIQAVLGTTYSRKKEKISRAINGWTKVLTTQVCSRQSQAYLGRLEGVKVKEESLHAYVGNQWTKYLLTAFHVYVPHNGVRQFMNLLIPLF